VQVVQVRAEIGLAGFDIMGYAEGPIIKVEDPV